MSKALFIIGNGFDLFHSIPSGYSDFKEHVKERNNKLFEALEYYFDADSLWSDFEGTLAYLDTEKIVEDASVFLVDYGAENWGDESHDDYPYEIQQAINVVTIQLREEFTRWVLSLKIPDIKKIILPKSAKYLNFNYTNTLEQTYEIPYDKILYIHNKAIDKESILILGHSRANSSKDNNTLMRTNQDMDYENNYCDYDTEDVRVAKGNMILDDYFSRTYKNTENTIEEKKLFFSGLSKIDRVYVLGHSMSEVDINYFIKVKESISKNAKWIVSYRNKEQISERRAILSNLDVESKNIKFIHLEEISL